MTNIIFFGSSEYSIIILKQLLVLPDFRLLSVVAKTDKPTGRNKTITPNPVAKFAIDHKLNLIQVGESFDEPFKLKIAKFHAQLGICVAFGPPFFDQEMIDFFPHKIINIHPSPLPKYRGAAPGPWQIINDEKTSAVTFFQIDKLPDHGPIISQIPLTISSQDNSQSFYEKAFSLAANNLDSILKKYLEKPVLLPQDHSQKSYFPKFTKEDGQIDWSWTQDKIERFVRALSPWPTAWTYVKNNQGKILKMKILSAKYNGQLQILNVVIEGKSPTTWAEIQDYYQIIKEN